MRTTKKKSVLVLFVFFFWLAYTTATLLQYLHTIEETYETEIRRHSNLIFYQSDLGKKLLDAKQFQTLQENLQSAFENRLIDLAILISPNQEPFVLALNGTVELAENYDPSENIIQEGNNLFRTVRSSDKSSTLTVGSDVSRKAFYQAVFSVHGRKMIFDIILITALSGFLIYLILKDLLQLTKILRRQSQQTLADLQSNSLEGQVLTNATQSFDHLSKELAWESQVFASSLGAAITTELRRGTTTPTFFSSVVVRVDLNQYTQRFLATDLKEMIKVLNLYFQTAREIIERYDGLIYEYVGDEIIFFFKVPKISGKTEADCRNLTLTKATHCIRDLFLDIEDLKLRNFTVKASLCLGDLNFVKLDQGYSFTGVPLIQTARMLGQVSHKSTNSLIILKSDLELLRPFIAESFDVQSTLKGFEGEHSLSEITAFTQSSAPNPIANRSTRDLINTLAEIQSDIQNKTADQALSHVSNLRKVHVHSANAELSAIFLQTLNTAFVERFDHRVLSGLVSLAQQYVPAKDYERILRPLLLKIERHSDERTRANSILTRAHYESDIDLSIKELKEHSNRLLADGLYVLGKKSVDNKLMKQIFWMIKHPERKYKASALYLCSALLRYHKENDIVYYKSNPLFEELKNILKTSMAATDQDLRKHAIQYQELSGEKL